MVPASRSSVSPRYCWLADADTDSELGLAASLFPHAVMHVTMALSAGSPLRGVQGKVSGDRDVRVHRCIQSLLALL